MPAPLAMAARGSGTENPVQNLTGRTFGNFLWTFAGGSAEAILKIIVLLVLARILLPQDFGVVSAALTVVALAEVTGRIGVAPSIVQVKELTQTHIGTGQVATLTMGAILGVVVFLLSGPIATLYQMPDLQPMIAVFSMLFVVRGAGLVGEALLQRSMQFRKLAMISLVSYLLGYAVVAITLALMGLGAWALVFGQIAQAVLLTLMLVYFSREGLLLGFSWSTFTQMFRFGLGVTLTQIGNYVSQNADFFIVGRWLGADALGYYSRAYLLLKQSAQLVGRVGDVVLFPTLATIQDDKPRLERALNRALSLVAMVQVPMTALLVVSAPEIINVLMGPQWDAAIIPFQILMGVLFFRTAYKFVGAILRATAKVYVAAIWQWSHAATVSVGAFAGQEYGLAGVSIGVSAAVVFCHLFGLFLVRSSIGVTSSASLRRLVVYTVLGAAFAAVLLAARFGLAAAGVDGLLRLLILFGGFGAVYLGGFMLVPGLLGEEGAMLKDQVARRLHRKRAPKDQS